MRVAPTLRFAPADRNGGAALFHHSPSLRQQPMPGGFPLGSLSVERQFSQARKANLNALLAFCG
jgi:hypothetical protein